MHPPFNNLPRHKVRQNVEWFPNVWGATRGNARELGMCQPLVDVPAIVGFAV